MPFDDYKRCGVKYIMEIGKIFKRFNTTAKYLVKGDFRTLTTRLYKEYYSFLFFFTKRRGKLINPNLKVLTEHKIAFESPDHIIPSGTMRDNNTNRAFVLLINKLLAREFLNNQLKFLDLGCAGGQLVRDFRDLGYISVGLEGSDYSLKHKRANWPLLAGKNLFTCNITKPFEIKLEEKIKFHLITAWEVLEHIPREDLDNVFKNVINHLEEGGYFIASTSSSSAISDGMQFHQTRMTNEEWRKYIQEKYRELTPVDLGLRYYQYVRYTIRGERSFLVYRKVSRF
jgi:2-polyprenyl-3-methyl-5-hydroxy-6-metoxy-1,4-benzoquinol methylase